jgi:hypothetical protein
MSEHYASTQPDPSDPPRTLLSKLLLVLTGQTTAASMTRAQRNTLTPTNGTIIYQTDSTPGFRGYVNGAWVSFNTTADP